MSKSKINYKPLFIQDKKILKTLKEDSIECARTFFESFSIDYSEEDLVKICFETMEFERARHWILEDALYFLNDFKEDLFISRYYQIGFKLDSARKEDLRILSPYLIHKMRMDDKFKKIMLDYCSMGWDRKKIVKKTNRSESTIYRNLEKIWNNLKDLDDND